MSEARTKLEQLEASTDWQALVDAALAAPPDPGPLFHRFNEWQQLFTVVYGGAPLTPDFPPSMDGFIRRIGFCNAPEPFHSFVDSFVLIHGRRPLKMEFPPNLAVFVDTLDRPKRRPRCDTKRLRDASKAWENFCFLHVYEMNRDLYKFLGRRPGVTITDFDGQTIKCTAPSDLAEVKLAEKIVKPVDYIRKRLKDARENRRKTIK